MPEYPEKLILGNKEYSTLELYQQVKDRYSELHPGANRSLTVLGEDLELIKEIIGENSDSLSTKDQATIARDAIMTLIMDN